MLIRRTILLTIVLMSLTACSGQASVTSNGALPVTLIEGKPLWVPVSNKQTMPMPQHAQVNFGDEIWSSADQQAVIQFADGSQILLSPNSRISLQPARPPDTRPTIRLVSGRMHAAAHGQNFLFESYREVPVQFRMVQYSLQLEPQGDSSGFSLWLEGDTARAQMDSGIVAVQSGDVQGTLQTGWEAELVPDQALQIIPPVTPTSVPTTEVVVPATPDYLPSPTPTPTPLTTPTSTSTPTPTPTLTPTPTPTRNATLIVDTATPTLPVILTPTNTSRPPSNPRPPKPTNPPPPKPTNPPPPQPTNPPPQPTNPPPP